MKLFNEIVSSVLDKYHFDIGLKEIKQMFMVVYPNRHYHTLVNHIIPMIHSITESYVINTFDEITYNKLILASVFHDIVYDPKSDINEIMSVDYMRTHVTTNTNMDVIDDVEDMILATIDHDLNDERFNDLPKQFIKYDLDIITKPFSELLIWEKQIQKEYEFVNWNTYVKERVKILNKIQSISLPGMNIDGLDSLIDYIQELNPKIAIYAGSFNPFHIGHMDILKKAENIFDKVIVAKGLNKSKNTDLVEWEDEFYILTKLLSGNEVVKYTGLLTDLIKEQGTNITLIRGLRNGYDLDAENTLTTFMKDMYPELKIVYISSDKHFEHISSSAIREIRSYEPKLVEKYLPLRKYI